MDYAYFRRNFASKRQRRGRWALFALFVMVALAATSDVPATDGGRGLTIEALGKRTGEMARLILSGTPPASIPFEIRADSLATFDWRALKRWGISEDRLPPNSAIRFRPRTLWEEYRWHLIGGLFILCVQSVIIADLLLQRVRRRRAEAELGESQQLMELATRAGELGLWSRKVNHDDVWVNAPLRSLFGFGAKDAVRFTDLLARVHPDDRGRMLREFDHAQTAGVPFQGEFRILLPNGKERWALAKGQTIYEPNGRDGRRMGVVMDITEHKRNAEALEKERSFLRQVLDIVPNFIFAKDREGRFTLANRAVADAYGTTVENLIGKTDADFNPHAEQVANFQQMDLAVMDTLQERLIPEEPVTDAQGKVRWLQTVKRPIIGKNGVADQVLGASADITQRKAAETELRQQRVELAHISRVSTMGELAASLAHELNQPLTAILSNAQAAQRFLSASPPDLEEVREILQDIVQDNNRAAEVIRRMRALVRKGELEIVPIDVTGVIRDVVLLVHGDATLHNIEVSLELSSDLPPVRGDKVQLQQVVLNLLLNAFDALRDCPVSERRVEVRAEWAGTRLIRVAVRDRGTGLHGDQFAKIFQPFYTTKGEGLGMGLAICRSIIEAHGGDLRGENNPDRGATFYFTVPVDGRLE